MARRRLCAPFRSPVHASTRKTDEYAMHRRAVLRHARIPALASTVVDEAEHDYGLEGPCPDRIDTLYLPVRTEYVQLGSTTPPSDVYNGKWIGYVGLPKSVANAE